MMCDPLCLFRSSFRNSASELSLKTLLRTKSDNKQLYRLKVPKKQIFELSPFIKNMCSTDFREGSLQQIKTKFCPRVMSMFVAFVRGISFQAEWIDILALIDVCSFYECNLVVTMSYLKRNFVAGQDFSQIVACMLRLTLQAT